MDSFFPSKVSLQKNDPLILQKMRYSGLKTGPIKFLMPPGYQVVNKKSRCSGKSTFYPFSPLLLFKKSPINKNQRQMSL